MTFRKQVRFARLWGSGAFALGMLGALLLKLGYVNVGVRPADWIVFLSSGLPIALGAVMLLFGGVVRPVQRRFYLYALKDSELRMFGMIPRERLTQWVDAGFWRWWLHTDREGNDLDARN